MGGDDKYPVTSMLFHHQYDGSPDGEAGGTKYTSRETEVALSDEAHTHHLTTYDLLYSLESFPKGISKLGTPVLNSSRIFQIALDSFDDKFDRDDFSVSTVVTSKSMMLRAAAIASNVSKDVNFFNLSCEDLEGMTKAMRGVDLVCHAAAYAHEGLSSFSPTLI